jgi:hypothetical protein
MHAQGAVAAHAEAVAQGFGLHDGAAMLLVLPLLSADGLAAALAALLSGARLLLPEDDASADALARAQNATHLLALPAQLTALEPLVARRPWTALGFAAAPGPAEAPTLAPRECWGSAETQGLFALRESAGFRPLPPATLHPGETLAIEAATLPGGALLLGLPVSIADGAFTPTGPRRDGVLQRDGLPVAPATLASFLRRQPGVAAVTVTGAAGRLSAAIRPLAEAPADMEALAAACRDWLGEGVLPAELVLGEELAMEAAA